MAEQTGTLNALSTTWDGLRDGFPEIRPGPRLRILYHVDLARLGLVSEPDIPLTADDWQIVGRKEPLFLGTVPGAPARPLEDPIISRRQLRVRWLAQAGQFEVEPCPGAKRALRLFDPAGGFRPLEESCRVPPDTCVAIGDRVLLALELARYRGPEEHRLGLVGESDVMWQLRDDIVEVAAFAGAALILGQTGTGKELVAHALHEQGQRAQAPFLTVNCAALPEHLVESLLFGHVKGAFTGATSEREGKFRAAHGGTLFLDELGEMPIAIQPKLLRTLEDGRVAPVGDHRTREVDVRLIAATNREPDIEIAAGRLRADLYHRVARHIVRIPELSRRRNDIPELFGHFLAQLRTDHASINWMWERASGWHRAIPMDFFVALLRCELPGNVRELRNLAERTARRNQTPGPFRAPGLPDAAPPEVPEPGTPAPDAAMPEPELLAEASRVLGLAHKTVAKLLPGAELSRLHRSAGEAGDDPQEYAARLHAYAADRLARILTEAHDVRSKAAAALGVSPTTLSKLVRHFDL